ncbi:hypothetical protein EDD76_106206 [Kineothrix alysoides]|uniref:DUF2147 domain-containing protein n=1 Tax=Kineothrix alysoides TaxID=1469948 RepID=A0A4R1QZV1_9FIRM|nr:hypothetical protein [Kineothrix alysoides]TCL58553.1 hypothetical protein EDD76_106206 [Kineothrix alysoides]
MNLQINQTNEEEQLYGQPRMSGQNDKFEIKRPDIKNKLPKIVIYIICIFFLSAIICLSTLNKSTHDLEGIWIRLPDDTSFENMKVEIRNDNGILEAEICAAPDGSSRAFQVGQIKWNDMKKNGLTTFTFYDLNEKNSGKASGSILMSNDKKTIYISHSINQGPGRGDYQIWKKVK